MEDEEPQGGIGLLSEEEAEAEEAPARPAPAAPAAAPKPAAPQPVGAPARPAAPEAPGPLSLKAADETERNVTAGTVTSLSAVLANELAAPASARVSVEVAYTSTYPGEGAEWPVSWLTPGKKTFQEFVRAQESVQVPIAPGAPVPFTFEVTAPVGVRYGDRVELRITARVEDGAAPGVRPARLTLAWAARQAVLAIKTSRGYEREVADTLLARAEEKRDVLFALLVPAALRGYVFAEGMSFEGVREMLKGIRKARGLVAGETTLKEVEPLLVPKITVEGFVEGAIVELIAGPFKGEKARVRKIDQAKEEITVELIEAVVPIPVTVRGDHVRMLERGGGKSGG
jgi:transcriptional antiterminator NusG